MTSATTQDYISLGQEHAVTFGKTQLTLKPGILAEGEPLPCTKGLVSHNLLPGYCIPGIKSGLLSSRHWIRRFVNGRYKTIVTALNQRVATQTGRYMC